VQINLNEVDCQFDFHIIGVESEKELFRGLSVIYRNQVITMYEKLYVKNPYRILPID